MRPHKILVIDDDVETREATVKLLKSLNFNVLEANSGEQGLEIIVHEPVDGVILDLIMQNMGGIDCLREIRRLYGKLPVFLYTDISNEALRREAEVFNATGYLIHKNLSRQELSLMAGLIDIYKGRCQRVDDVDDFLGNL
jgi:CheY-like chemotaxis protein